MSTRSARYTSQKLHIPKGRMASGSDRDASKFLEAATIYDSRQQRAIYELVRLLKQYGLWSKMKAIYPFVGGTATTHKWNLKDPQDTDAAFRLTFSGGWTHSSTGADPNGTTGYADSYVIPTTHLTNNSTHLSFYSRENGTSGLAELASAAADPNRLELITNTNGFAISDHYNYNTNRVQQAPGAIGSGFFVSNRNSSTNHKFWRNNTQISGTNTNTSSGYSSLIYNIYISSLRIPAGANYYSEKECAFASIGDGLTDTEAANLYYAVQRYQQILGRAV